MAYVEELEQENRRLRRELLDKKFIPATTWGNCKRGCAPAYLDKDGFCSPACAMGAPKGEFVTYVSR